MNNLQILLKATQTNLQQLDFSFWRKTKWGGKNCKNENVLIWLYVFRWWFTLLVNQKGFAPPCCFCFLRNRNIKTFHLPNTQKGPWALIPGNLPVLVTCHRCYYTSLISHLYSRSVFREMLLGSIEINSKNRYAYRILMFNDNNNKHKYLLVGLGNHHCGMQT